MFNSRITKMLIDKFSSLTLSTDEGKFLADKSYGFDTMFFVARFIQRFSFGNIYRKLDLQDKSNEYIQDLFCLRGGSQIPNYFTEGVALLVFTKVLKKHSQNEYEIIDFDLLEFLGSSLENAYIFQYMLCYCVFKHDGIWDNYLKFCKAEHLEEKQRIYLDIRQQFIDKDFRIINPNAEWANFVPKYPMIVLNYANRQNMVARTTNIKPTLVERKDIALNTKGTRANQYTPKKNAYIQEMSESYIIETLRPYLTYDPPKYAKIEYSDYFSNDLADTKLDLLDVEGVTTEMREKIQAGRYKYTKKTGQTRTVQSEFRTGLFLKTPHKCPICGFDFSNLLIASHIKPYAKCEDTYDAMNPNNGLLMCPVCDKLFESANYITIDSQTGDVIYDTELEDEKSLTYLKGKTIRSEYVDCERRHYLKWHNELFYQKHPAQANG